MEILKGKKNEKDKIKSILTIPVEKAVLQLLKDKPSQTLERKCSTIASNIHTIQAGIKKQNDVDIRLQHKHGRAYPNTLRG